MLLTSFLIFCYSKHKKQVGNRGILEFTISLVMRTIILTFLNQALTCLVNFCCSKCRRRQDIVNLFRVCNIFCLFAHMGTTILTILKLLSTGLVNFCLQQTSKAPGRWWHFWRAFEDCFWCCLFWWSVTSLIQAWLNRFKIVSRYWRSQKLAQWTGTKVSQKDQQSPQWATGLNNLI
jgi:hypothetical protein